MRFSLKRLLLATATIAFFAGVWKSSGLASAVVLAAAGALLIAAMHWQRQTARTPAIAASLLAVFLIWMANVDRYYTWSHCPSCLHVKSVTSLRLLGYPLAIEKQSTASFLELIAADLGVPCTHSNIEAIRHNRDWGLLIRQGENGTIALTDDYEWYDDDISSRLERLGRDNPSIAHEFQQRVLINRRDMSYLNDIAFSAGITKINAQEAIALADSALDKEGHDLTLLLQPQATYGFETGEWHISYYRADRTSAVDFLITIDGKGGVLSIRDIEGEE